MIRYGTKQDISQLKILWENTFGFDTSIKDYFDNLYMDNQVLVYEKAGSIVSMLHMMTCNIDGHLGYYLYALATAVEYRNMGIMSELIKYAINDKAKTGDFLFLVPENIKLMAYYEKFGFKELKYNENSREIIFSNATREYVKRLQKDNPEYVVEYEAILSFNNMIDLEWVYGYIPF